ncbi:hypothetical protein T06_11933 [Trichinella sp. T6]|nr:hypothetical protein T06_11933 [Trichinella sp. T6]
MTEYNHCPNNLIQIAIFESCRAKSRDNMDSFFVTINDTIPYARPLVYLKKYAITDGPVLFIILSE